MSCLGQKKKSTKKFSVIFVSFCCVQFEEYKFDELLKNAKLKQREEEIFDATDSKGDLPFQIAADHCNFVALKWIFEKWQEHNKTFDINLLNSKGCTALIQCCLKSF